MFAINFGLLVWNTYMVCWLWVLSNWFFCLHVCVLVCLFTVVGLLWFGVLVLVYCLAFCIGLKFVILWFAYCFTCFVSLGLGLRTFSWIALFYLLVYLVGLFAVFVACFVFAGWCLSGCYLLFGYGWCLFCLLAVLCCFDLVHMFSFVCCVFAWDLSGCLVGLL